MSIIPNKGSRKSLEFVWNFSFLIHENRIFCLFPYSRGCAYAKTRMKIAIFIRVFSFSHSFCRSCFSFSNSSSDKVMPLPIFACSGAQSRMSYLGVPPFHEILFSSFVHPFGLLETTPRCSMISYLNSAILITIPGTSISYFELNCKTEFTEFISKKGQESLTQKLEPSSKSAQIFMRAHAYNRLLRARF